MAECKNPATYCDNITDCPICTGTLQDPIILPCIHTFCLLCISRFVKQIGDELACPLCEKSVKIPVGGISKLPRNFFVEKLLEVKRLVSSLPVCEVCDEGCKPATAERIASVYCTECQQHLCQQCTGIHRKMKVSSSHHLNDVGSRTVLREMMGRESENVCDSHRTEFLKMYCYDCKLSICTVCRLGKHAGHRCRDLGELANEMSVKILDDVADVNAKLLACKRLQQELKAAADESKKRRGYVKNDIFKRAEYLKKLIDECRDSLTGELCVEEKQDEAHVATIKATVESQTKMLESFNKYSKELANTGVVGDLMKATTGLHNRAQELKWLNVRVTSGIGSYRAKNSACFLADGSVGDEVKKLFGRLDKKGDISDNFPQKVEVLHAFPAPAANSRGFITVGGVASLGNELFVVRYCSRELVVYDANTFNEKHKYSFPAQRSDRNNHGLRACVGCEVNRCVYIADGDDSVIHKMQPFDNALSEWSIDRNPRAMSLTSSRNVLLLMNANSEVILGEYSTNGKIIRSISLSSVHRWPVCAVELARDRYGMTCASGHSKFITFDVNGTIIKSYGILSGSAPGQLNGPCGIAVNRHGFIFVADTANDRIVVFNTAADALRALPLRVPDGGLKHPNYLFLDQTRDRLYIGESCGRLLVADKVNDLRFD